jgi:hypothetical protein
MQPRILSPFLVAFALLFLDAWALPDRECFRPCHLLIRIVLALGRSEGRSVTCHLHELGPVP